MHIPDGYLSPETCAAAYALAAPFWAVAFRRVRRLLHTRMVPLLAVFSAFSFVIMMFNLPLPGGTTGHAVGMAVAAIVLGPWAATVAISVALLIQAVFFGDGGITTFAANCLNMAVAGTFVAWWTYTLIAGRSPARSTPHSPRRVVAAAIAGYLAINVAALLTALEFGIQPALFHDATGTPLYAPYPLSVALPAMMIGHVSIAGLAEALVTGGLIGWLQRSHPDVLTFAATSPRSLWAWLAALAALAAATPLGLIAAGTAWGEWSIEDFAGADARQEILRASGGVAPLETVPAGLERLAGVWQAPLPDYAPAFLHDLSVGYVLSAAVGAGLILALFLAFAALARRKGSTP